MTPKTPAEKAYEAYARSIPLGIKMGDEPFWSSDKHWFKSGYESRDPEVAALKAEIAQKTGENERLREALKDSFRGFNDWLHCYAPEECGKDYVAETRERISERGTLHYIATRLEIIKEALGPELPEEGK